MHKHFTYPYKKVYHKKYIEGEVDLLSNILTPVLMTYFHCIAKILQTLIFIKAIV